MYRTALYPPKVAFLAFGGYFANSIFFFASGYCLTNVKTVFPKWYGKRFIRIYLPYLLILPFLYFAGSLEGLDWVNIVMPFKDYHFIPSILFFVHCVLSSHQAASKDKDKLSDPDCCADCRHTHLLCVLF